MSLSISENRQELFKALVQFRENVKQPNKDGVNPFTKSNYVTIDALVAVIDETAPVYGLTYIQIAKTDEHGRASVSTVIMHESGEYMELPPLCLPVDKNTAQAYGSAITYARRYTLSAAFGLASEADDDGNAASGRGNNHYQQQQRYQQPQQQQYRQQTPQNQPPVQQQQQAPQGQQQNNEPPLELGEFMKLAKEKEVEIKKGQPDFGTKKVQAWILNKMKINDMQSIPEGRRREYLSYADELVKASKKK